MENKQSQQLKNRDKAPWGPGFSFLVVASGYTITLLIFFILDTYLSSSIKETLMPDSESWQTFVYQAAAVIPIISVVIIAVYLSGGKLRDLGFKKSKLSLVTTSTLTVFASYVLATIVLSSLLAFVVPEDVLNAEQNLGIDADFSSWSAAAPLLLSVLILAPISEEIIFRGFIFKGIRSRTSFWTAAIISSLAFAAVHIQINVMVDVFIMAIGAAWLMERTNTIYAPIVLHVVKNSVAVMIIATNAL